MQGPHCPAFSPANQRATCAVSASPQLPRGRAKTIPQPSEPPTDRIEVWLNDVVAAVTGSIHEPK